MGISKTIRLLPIVCFFLTKLPVGFSQTEDSRNIHDILFYNTENFFDPLNDSLTLDDEFTPGGEKHWTWKRFQQKANHLYKLFMAAGTWDPPGIIGLAEVENDYVLYYLTQETPFAKYNYGYVHYESPDIRGIDVALLYCKDRYRVLTSYNIPVVFPGNSHKKTRDILYVLLYSRDEDTLAVFVNHWPSRKSGYQETEPFRLRAARTLVKSLDTLMINGEYPRTVIMGDFNDEPEDPSVQEITGSVATGGRYVNLMIPSFKKNEGTLYYNHRWWLFDQFMVSRDLVPGKREIRIIRLGFLLQEDNAGRPFRTYTGLRYLGGFSDHLPVLMKIELN